MFNIQIRVHTVYLRRLSVRAQYSNLCPSNSSSRYHCSLENLNTCTRDRRQVYASYHCPGSGSGCFCSRLSVGQSVLVSDP
jgi:hypothetical protein